MIHCPLCKGASNRIWKERKHRVYRCKNCSVAFLEPVPECVEKTYSKDYFQEWYIKYYEERKQYTENLFLLLEEHIKAKGKLLDVGCGVGILLETAKEKGWDVYGQDIAPFPAAYCKEKGFNIFNGPLQELNFPEESFDVITMFDVLAHLKDPVSYINTSVKLLKPDGYLIIKTPHHPCSLFFLANLLSFTGKSRSLLHIPAQIFHFTSHSLSTVLSAENLKMVYLIRQNDFSSYSGKHPLLLMIPSKTVSLLTLWKKTNKGKNLCL